MLILNCLIKSIQAKACRKGLHICEDLFSSKFSHGLEFIVFLVFIF